MTRYLETAQLQINRAHVESLLRAAGAYDWTDATIEKYKKAALLKEQPVLYRMLHMLHPVLPMPVLVGALLIGGTMALSTAEWPTPYYDSLSVVGVLLVFVSGYTLATMRVWRTAPVEEFQGMRGRTIPPEALQIMARVRSMMGPAKFEVAYTKRDPVLYVSVLPKSPYYLGPNSIPILVWETVDGKEVVLKPPT